MAKDYYKILGVNRTATADEIKKAYRTLAHEHHPDKASGNSDRFKEINEAYQVLGNKDKRQQYDQFGTTFESMGRQGGYSWQNAHAGGNPFSRFGFGQDTFDFGDLGDMMGDMFGFGARTRSRAQTRARRGSDIKTEIPLSFDESYFGTQKDIKVYALIRCKHCNDTGSEPGAKTSACATCRGSGRVFSTRDTFIGTFRTETICAECGGAGSKTTKKCTLCHGTTQVKEYQTVKVKIPAGIDEDRTIRLTGRGEAGAFGGPPGDLYIQVRIQSHKHFIRDGYNIKSREEAPLSTLIEGGSILVETPSGSVKLSIPPHTKSGTIFSLQDKGFEKLAGRGRGDLLVTLHAAVPSRLTAKQKKLLEEFEESLSAKKTDRSWWR